MKSFKLALAIVPFVAASISGSALAAQKPAPQTAQFNVAAMAPGQMNCGRYLSQVCFKNKSSSVVYVSVPAFNAYNNELDPGDRAYIGENVKYYANIRVKAQDQYGDPIFNRFFPNHSVIVFTNNASNALTGHAHKVSYHIQ